MEYIYWVLDSLLICIYYVSGKSLLNKFVDVLPHLGRIEYRAHKKKGIGMSVLPTVVGRVTAAYFDCASTPAKKGLGLGSINLKCLALR